MINTLPSQSLDLLRSFLGKKIILVKRQLFKDDMDLDEWQQNADGPVELIFDDDTVVHFIIKTEVDSIGVVAGEMPCYGDSYVSVDVSDNSFWCDRLRQKINQLVYLRSSDWSEDYPSEFGIEISFNNEKKVLIEYLNEEESPDMIKVAEQYTGEPCITIQINNNKS